MRCNRRTLDEEKAHQKSPICALPHCSPDKAAAPTAARPTYRSLQADNCHEPRKATSPSSCVAGAWQLRRGGVWSESACRDGGRPGAAQGSLTRRETPAGSGGPRPTGTLRARNHDAPPSLLKVAKGRLPAGDGSGPGPAAARPGPRPFQRHGTVTGCEAGLRRGSGGACQCHCNPAAGMPVGQGSLTRGMQHRNCQPEENHGRSHPKRGTDASLSKFVFFKCKMLS